MVEHCKISNSKHQITNKSQIPILNEQNRFGICDFGHCDLFDICDLEFLLLQYSSIPLVHRGEPRFGPSDSPPFGWGPGLSADDQEIGRPSKANVQVPSESGCGFALQKQLHPFHRIEIQHNRVYDGINSEPFSGDPTRM